MALVAQEFGLRVLPKPKMLGFFSIGSPKCWATEQKDNKGYAKLTIGSPSFVRKYISFPNEWYLNVISETE